METRRATVDQEHNYLDNDDEGETAQTWWEFGRVASLAVKRNGKIRHYPTNVLTFEQKVTFYVSGLSRWSSGKG